MTAVSRLFGRTLLRPGPSLLLLGAAILASNWVWYGSGIFLGQRAGLALTIAGLLGFGYAAYGLVRGRHQLLALSIFIVAAVLLPALALLALRSTTGAPLLMHDGAYQTEEAIKLVVAGHDPYGVDYSLTSMRLWHWYVNQPVDSSLLHYVYSPLTFLIGVPFFVGARLLAIPFDFRIVLILAALAAGGGLLRLPWRWDLRYVALAALFLDPFFYFPQGRNDILFLAPLTLGVLAWARGTPRLAALAFGVAFAFKPFALFFLPCVAIALWPRSGPLLERARRLAILGAALLAPAAVTMGPFLLWNAHAYWTDTVSFVAGSGHRALANLAGAVARLRPDRGDPRAGAFAVRRPLCQRQLPRRPALPGCPGRRRAPRIGGDDRLLSAITGGRLTPDTVTPARIRVRRYGCVLARRGRFDSRLEAAVEYAFAP